MKSEPSTVSQFQVETACYTINVRGSEVPKHMLASFFSGGGGGKFDGGGKGNNDPDEANAENFED